jgi:hypothetical protein
METGMVEPNLETDAVKMVHQPASEVLPFIETALTENQRLHIELGNSADGKQSVKQELLDVRSQLEIERVGQKIEAEFSEKLTPDATTILSQLRAKRKKSPVSLTDIKTILEIIEES